jgi:hypothetical protein
VFHRLRVVETAALHPLIVVGNIAHSGRCKTVIPFLHFHLNTLEDEHRIVRCRNDLFLNVG